MFLDPATGLAALLGGVGLTLLWYFLKLRRRSLRVSSTALWAQAARDLEVNAPLRWIRPSWLLLLQLLAVGLLAGAAGRPAISGGLRAPERWVLVIDRSASMRATDGTRGRTRFEEALDEARTIVERMGDGERAMVASFAVTARLDAAMTPDRGVLLAAIDSLEATDQPGELSAAMELVAAQLGENSGGARVVLLSDGGFGEAVTSRVGDADVRFARAGPASDEPSTNTGVLAMSARRDQADPATLRCFVRIGHVGAGDRDATVSVFFNDELMGAETRTVSAGGEESFVLETRRIEAGSLRAVIAGRDALASDNEAWVVVSDARGETATIVHPDDVGVDPFLERAVEVAFGSPPALVSAPEWEQGGGGAPSVVVFDRCETERGARGASLHVGAGAPWAGVRLLRLASESAGRVLAWDRSHPALRSASLGSVLIADAVALEWDDGAPVRGLATGDAGVLIAAVDEGAVRRLVLGFGPGDSNWETDPSFPLVVQLVKEWLAPSSSGAGVSHTTGEGLALAGVGAEVVVRGSVERRSEVREDGLARFGAFDQVGLYEVEGAADSLLAVNLFDPIESGLATRDELRIGGEAVAGGGADSVTTRELWRWFVVVGLALASAEWLLYARRMRV